MLGALSIGRALPTLLAPGDGLAALSAMGGFVRPTSNDDEECAPRWTPLIGANNEVDALSHVMS